MQKLSSQSKVEKGLEVALRAELLEDKAYSNSSDEDEEKDALED